MTGGTQNYYSKPIGTSCISSFQSDGNQNFTYFLTSKAIEKGSNTLS